MNSTQHDHILSFDIQWYCDFITFLARAVWVPVYQIAKSVLARSSTFLVPQYLTPHKEWVLEDNEVGCSCFLNEILKHLLKNRTMKAIDTIPSFFFWNVLPLFLFFRIAELRFHCIINSMRVSFRGSISILVIHLWSLDALRSNTWTMRIREVSIYIRTT